MNTPSEQQRRHLCAAPGATLDGAPAVISGWRLPFAKVTRRDGRGEDCEFSWDAAVLIMNTNRRFQS